MRAWVLAGLIFCLCVPAAQAAGSWRILKDHWSTEDEQGFGQFVAAIGASNCSSSESCLRDMANPYRKTDQRFLDIDVDCAKWPYLLRAYYAWKNSLPFSYVDGVSGSGDLRFSKTANHPVARHDVLDRGNGIDAPSTIRGVIGTVFSGTYRTDPSDHHGVQSDFYSPAPQPGTLLACLRCRQTSPVGSRFCSACGAAL